MAGSVNKVILVGNLGADPEVRQTQDGRSIANLRIATSETWKDKQTGEKREKTEWSRVVIFNDALAKVAEKYCKKGSKIYVEGKLQTRKWQDKDGVDRFSTEVVLQGFDGTLVLLGSANGNGNGGERGDPGPTVTDGFGSPSKLRATNSKPAPSVAKPSMEDEVPF